MSPQMIQLSPDQLRAKQLIVHWALNAEASGNLQFVLAGLAGTGKTTLVRSVLDDIPFLPSVCAPTGKAAMVLSKKIQREAKTIHSLMYRPLGEVEDEDGNTELIFAERSAHEFQAPLLVIDEGSMVGNDMYQEIAMRQIPTLWIGDQGQLPPIKSKDPKLFQSPDYTLQQIHRQGAGSPILDLAYHVREGGSIRANVNNGINRVGVHSPEDVAREFIARDIDVLLCAENNARMSINQKIREMKGTSGSTVAEGERVVCLKNDYPQHVVNGEIFIVERVVSENSNQVRCDVVSETGRKNQLTMLKAQFSSKDTLFKEAYTGKTLFTYAYAMTCHKAQGSQYSHVGVLDHKVRDAKRWHYTAVTRAVDEVTVFCTPR